VDGVKAASKAFYTALAALDGGAAMEKVWAHMHALGARLAFNWICFHGKTPSVAQATGGMERSANAIAGLKQKRADRGRPARLWRVSYSASRHAGTMIVFGSPIGAHKRSSPSIWRARAKSWRARRHFLLASIFCAMGACSWFREHDLTRARQLVKESGYDGRPIVVIQVTDIAFLSAAAIVSVSIGATVRLTSC
jgi:hypothetical protein